MFTAWTGIVYTERGEPGFPLSAYAIPLFEREEEFVPRRLAICAGDVPAGNIGNNVSTGSDSEAASSSITSSSGSDSSVALDTTTENSSSSEGDMSPVLRPRQPPAAPPSASMLNPVDVSDTEEGNAEIDNDVVMISISRRRGVTAVPRATARRPAARRLASRRPASRRPAAAISSATVAPSPGPVAAAAAVPLPQVPIPAVEVVVPFAAPIAEGDARGNTNAAAGNAQENLNLPGNLNAQENLNAAPNVNANRPPLILNQSMNAVNFDCCVCLENLGKPSSIAEQTLAGANGDPLLGPEGMPLTGARKNAAVKKLQTLSAIDPRETCATSCGHMYHTFCIQKWFFENKKTCPSCRKNVTGKPMRLFPTTGQDGGSMNQTGSDGAIGNELVLYTGEERQRNAFRTNCQNPQCTFLADIHETLVEDYNGLQLAYVQQMDDLGMKTAENASLQEQVAQLNQQVTKLTKDNEALMVQAAAAEESESPGAGKRRRR